MRVRVAGTTFNGVDANIRAGRMQGPMPLTLPHVPGLDVAGTVDALGDGVDGLQVGDRVVGFLPFVVDGASADYVLAPAESLAPAPTSIPLADAAALPVVGLTAWQALFEHADLSSGQRILINGASGAVGGYAVQLAKAAGAHVIATGSARSSEHLLALGADEVVDHTTTEVSAAVDRAGRRPAQPRADHPRAVRERWPPWSATAASSSTPPCGCPPRATRRAACAASTSTSAATPTQLAELVGSRRPRRARRRRRRAGARCPTSPRSTHARPAGPSPARSSSSRPTTRGDPARLPSRRLGEGPTGTAS